MPARPTPDAQPADRIAVLVGIRPGDAGDGYSDIGG